MSVERCARCAGKGSVESRREFGVCFRCWGRGVVPTLAARRAVRARTQELIVAREVARLDDIASAGAALKALAPHVGRTPRATARVAAARAAEVAKLRASWVFQAGVVKRAATVVPSWGSDRAEILLAVAEVFGSV